MYCVDDLSPVTPITLSAVLAQRAYMLFYVKRSLAFAPPAASIVNGNGVGSTRLNGVGGKTLGGQSGHRIRSMAA